MLDIEYSVSEAPMPPATQLRVCVLASGSSGNCIHVESPTTALLIDAGLSARETLRRMAAAGLDPAKLRAICIYQNRMFGDIMIRPYKKASNDGVAIGEGNGTD